MPQAVVAVAAAVYTYAVAAITAVGIGNVLATGYLIYSRHRQRGKAKDAARDANARRAAALDARIRQYLATDIPTVRMFGFGQLSGAIVGGGGFDVANRAENENDFRIVFATHEFADVGSLLVNGRRLQFGVAAATRKIYRTAGGNVAPTLLATPAANETLETAWNKLYGGKTLYQWLQGGQAIWLEGLVQQSEEDDAGVYNIDRFRLVIFGGADAGNAFGARAGPVNPASAGVGFRVATAATDTFKGLAAGGLRVNQTADVNSQGLPRLGIEGFGFKCRDPRDSAVAAVAAGTRAPTMAEWTAITPAASRNPIICLLNDLMEDSERPTLLQVDKAEQLSRWPDLFAEAEAADEDVFLAGEITDFPLTGRVVSVVLSFAPTTMPSFTLEIDNGAGFVNVGTLTLEDGDDAGIYSDTLTAQGVVFKINGFLYRTRMGTGESGFFYTYSSMRVEISGAFIRAKITGEKYFLYDSSDDVGDKMQDDEVFADVGALITHNSASGDIRIPPNNGRSAKATIGGTEFTIKTTSVTGGSSYTLSPVPDSGGLCVRRYLCDARLSDDQPARDRILDMLTACGGWAEDAGRSIRFGCGRVKAPRCVIDVAAEAMGEVKVQNEEELRERRNAVKALFADITNGSYTGETAREKSAAATAADEGLELLEEIVLPATIDRIHALALQRCALAKLRLGGDCQLVLRWSALALRVGDVVRLRNGANFGLPEADTLWEVEATQDSGQLDGVQIGLRPYNPAAWNNLFWSLAEGSDLTLPGDNLAAGDGAGLSSLRDLWPDGVGAELEANDVYSFCLLQAGGLGATADDVGRFTTCGWPVNWDGKTWESAVGLLESLPQVGERSNEFGGVSFRAEAVAQAGSPFVRALLSEKSGLKALDYWRVFLDRSGRVIEKTGGGGVNGVGVNLPHKIFSGRVSRIYQETGKRRGSGFTETKVVVEGQSLAAAWDSAANGRYTAALQAARGFDDDTCLSRIPVEKEFYL